MADTTHDSERIMAGARGSLAEQRAGGRRQSIGQGSARLKARHRKQKLKRLLIAVFAIVIAAMGVGLFVGALGFEGLFVTVLALIVAVAVLAKYPRMELPSRENLARGDLQNNVARTELWLETQRPALPAPAVQIVDRIGVQLDGLGVQLQGLDDNAPPLREIRKLVTQHLPEMVASYTAIPPHLRQEQRGSASPDAQLADGLSRISAEIDSVTRQLAEGAMDDLAIRTKFLDYRYGQDVAALPGPPDTVLGDTALGATGLGDESGVPLTPPGARATSLPQTNRGKPD